jgi:hypothetical protein
MSHSKTQTMSHKDIEPNFGELYITNNNPNDFCSENPCKPTPTVLSSRQRSQRS